MRFVLYPLHPARSLEWRYTAYINNVTRAQISFGFQERKDPHTVWAHIAPVTIPRVRSGKPVSTIL